LSKIGAIYVRADPSQPPSAKGSATI